MAHFTEENSIYNKASWMIPYIKNGDEISRKYTYKSNKKIVFKCPDCGFEFQKTIAYVSLYGFHCKKCDDGISYPNKLSYAILDELQKLYNIKHIEHEYSPEWCGRYRFDNYFEFNGKKYILEMDGGFHKNGFHTKSSYSPEYRRNIDMKKDAMAIEHGIELIRIDCEPSTFEKIKDSFLNSEMNELFDLSTINWDDCNCKAQKNIIKEVCDYYRNNPSLTTTDIGKVFHLFTTTVAKYLKIGTNIGWCSYCSDVERRKYQASKLGHCVLISDIISGITYKFSSLNQASIQLKRQGINLPLTSIRRYIDTNTIYQNRFLINTHKEKEDA